MNTEDKLFCHNDRPETIKPTIESISAERDKLKADNKVMLDALIKCYNHIKNDMCICGIIAEAKEAIERATGDKINQEGK